jgi:hypothetical protein
MRRFLFVTIAAAAAILGVAALPAAAATATAPGPPIYSQEQAGYAAGGQGIHMRYVQATFKLPSSTTLPFNTGGGLSVQLRSPNDNIVLGISATPGSQWNAAVFESPYGCEASSCLNYSNGDSPVMDTGDTISASIYYDVGNGFAYYTLTDVTAGTSFFGKFSDPGALFNQARVGEEFADWPWAAPSSPYVAPVQNTRLAAFSDVAVTSYNGTHGNLFGPFQVSKIFMTRNGKSWGKAEGYPGLAWNKGLNFGAWLHA